MPWCGGYQGAGGRVTCVYGLRGPVGGRLGHGVPEVGGACAGLNVALRVFMPVRASLPAGIQVTRWRTVVAGHRLITEPGIPPLPVFYLTCCPHRGGRESGS